MSSETTDKFSGALTKLINYFVEKYDLTYAEVIGTMQMKIMDTWDSAPVYGEEEEDDA